MATSFYSGSGLTTTEQDSIESSIAAAEAAKAAAEAAKVAAETAETNAETAEANAETSKTGAETAETNAASSATAAASSATNAASSLAAIGNSETNAATSATNAASSATNSSNSASAASTAQTAAEVAQTAAETAETNAETAETNAASSATSAATSATNSSNSASASATSATNAASSATSASTSATTATTKASEASTSATNAATSETNAATSATNAASSATSASTSATTATTKASEASTSASNASTSETNAAASASTASTKASEASTSASNASTSETNAATSATNAASSATAAQSAQAAAELAFDNFDDKFLGTFSSDPTTDNDGNALVTGAMYYNDSSNAIKFYDGSAWEAPETAASNSASAANTSATSAATSATNAATSATSAATSATNAASSLASFTGQYSSGATDPTTNLNAGDLFFNTTANELRVYNGTSWQGGVTSGNATQSTDGTMSSADKTKLDGVEASADVTDTTNVVAALTAGDNITIAADGTVAASGGDITVQDEGSSLATAATALNFTGTGVTASGTGASKTINITDTNTTYSNATTSAAGLMSSSDKTKIDGIATGATNVTNTNQLTNGAGFITSADGGNAATLDGIDSTSFLRSDANDSASGTITFPATGFKISSDVTLSHSTSHTWKALTIQNEGDTNEVSIHGLSNQGNQHFLIYGGAGDSGFLDPVNYGWRLKIPATSGSLLRDNLHTIWDSGNDGSGSGLDADTLDGVQGSSFLRSDANDSTSGTLTANQLKVGSASGYFFNDSSTRTAFTGGDFYIQSISNYYNYATSQYHGGTSGDSHYFRGNTLSGDSWSLTGNGNFTTNNLYMGNALLHSGDTDTYIQFATNEIRMLTGNSQEVTINTTGVRLGDTGNGYFQPVSGNYGSIQIDGGAHGGYEGYSIGGRVVLMHNNSTTTGIYNDVDNEWLFRAIHNGSSYLYNNGSPKVEIGASYMEMSQHIDMNNYDIYGCDQIFHHGDTNTYMQFHASDQWRVVTGGAERLEVNNSQVTVAGNLVVGGTISGGGAGVAYFANIDGTGTVNLRRSSGMSSVTDSGTGNYNPNLSPTLASANHAPVSGGAAMVGSSWQCWGSIVQNMATNTFRIYCAAQGTTGAGLGDWDIVTCVGNV